MTAVPQTIDDRIFDLAPTALDTLPVGVITLDRRGRVVRYNATEAAFARRTVDDTLGKQFFRDVAPCTQVQEFEGRFRAFACERDSGVERFDFTFPFRWGRSDVSITLLRRAGVEDINIVVTARSETSLPVSEVLESADRIIEPRHVRFAPAYEEAPTEPGELTASWSDDYETGSVRWSSELFAFVGIPPEDEPVPGGTHAFVHPSDAERVERIVRDSLAAEKPYSIEHRILGRDGTTRYVQVHAQTVVDAGGRPVRAAGTVVDVTARRGREIQLWQAAHFDALTGLANRALLAERIEAALDDTGNIGRFVAVLFIDLDRFKMVNDSAGHAVGDELLRMVARRIERCARPADTVARLNGDEFVLLAAGIVAEGEADRIASDLLAAISEPFVIHERAHFITSSVGVSVFPKDGITADELLRAADVGMYQSKERGANGFVRFSEEIRTSVSERGMLDGELRDATGAGEFELYFQPIVVRGSHAVVAAEALIRWHHPRRGLVMPNDFIPLAEANGSIVGLGEWLIYEACRQSRRWIDAGHPPIRMTVNVSVAQLAHRSLGEAIVGALAETGIPAELLELELTESVASSSFFETMKMLSDLKLLGVRLAIDDFGTGYSSLAYLKHFPIDTLKLDRAFVANVVTDEVDRAIASTVVALADKLRLDVVAEGIETPEQARTIEAIGCSLLQGYAFGRPQAASAFWETHTAGASIEG